ncbi:hypothetical protein E8E11_009524 [Didymella keratinophila]|nr:hypothetical protein E8E11_009524 [Didymella keratinophila]
MDAMRTFNDTIQELRDLLRQKSETEVTQTVGQDLLMTEQIENLDTVIRRAQAKRAELNRGRDRYREVLKHVYTDPMQTTWESLPALKPFKYDFFAQVSTRFPREIRDQVFAHDWTEDQLKTHHVQVSRALRDTKNLDPPPLLDQNYVGGRMALEMLEAYHKARRN